MPEKLTGWLEGSPRIHPQATGKRGNPGVRQRDFVRFVRVDKFQGGFHRPRLDLGATGILPRHRRQQAPINSKGLLLDLFDGQTGPASSTVKRPLPFDLQLVALLARFRQRIGFQGDDDAPGLEV